MKTLTLTFHHTTNYGATFQAYALQRRILSLGHSNLLFEYPDSKKYYFKIPLFKPKLAIRNLYINYTLFIRKKEHNELSNSFKRFKKNNMYLTSVFNSLDDLRQNTPDVDCLITGSDQVWNMNSNSNFKPAYFLDFGDENMIRFSYAASIEKLNYTEDQKQQVKRWLSKFKGISLREESAKEYIESFTEYKCERVLDPVFLLTKEEWIKVSKEPRLKEPYILCYQVLSNVNMQNVVNELKKRTGYPIVSICNSSHKWINSDYSFFDVSPEEFLGFYNKASIIVSSSFHGTALGVIFNKPTYSLIKNVSSNRVTDLMTKLNLKEFLITKGNELPEPIIDVDKLKTDIDDEINKSLDFLKKMLNEK